MFSKIVISLTMLILIMFGTGGIGVAQCSCTGKTTLVLPIERGCCPMESDCMTITVAHFSDYEVQHLTDTPQPVVVSFCQVFGQTDICNSRLSIIHESKALDNPPPTADFIGTVVLRV